MIHPDWIEINIDGVIGPTHHFGGLGVGNLASLGSRNSNSNPRAAALEGLQKMQLLDSLGVPQYFLPPLKRPNWDWLATLGYRGGRAEVLKRCMDQSPQLLSAAYSSAFMWMANAGTVAPASDTLDGKLHIVPANLCSSLHRGQEAAERRKQLQDFFRDVSDAIVHEPLPAVFPMRDEGAANHIRLCSRDRAQGVHLLVYGPPMESNGMRFMSRQSEGASRQVARSLCLQDSDVVFAQQPIQAIDSGVFHNDVIAMSHASTLIYHEASFDGSDAVVGALAKRFHQKTGEALRMLHVSEQELTLKDAVSTYLFNSQLVELNHDEIAIICPVQCGAVPQSKALIQRWIEDASNPIAQVHFLPLNESMANGGGPACLRLRVVLSSNQLKSVQNRYRADASRISALTEIVTRMYPESVNLSDMAQLEFAEHALQIVDELGRV
jgi:succinylarginine dihydrolase